jgi:hypothetical protein
VAWLFGTNPAKRREIGMFAGLTIGFFVGKEQATRSRMESAIFVAAVFMNILMRVGMCEPPRSFTHG